MTDVTVKLSRAYRAHQKAFDAVTLREPSFGDVYGDGRGPPTEWQRSAAGVMVLITRHEVVGEYIQILAKEPTAEHLSGLAAIDAIRLGEAVKDFFTEPPEPASAPTS